MENKVTCPCGNEQCRCTNVSAVNFVQTGPPINYGWVCPMCNTAYAPTMVQCFCSKQGKTVTTTTSSDS